MPRLRERKDAVCHAAFDKRRDEVLAQRGLLSGGQ